MFLHNLCCVVLLNKKRSGILNAKEKVNHLF